MHQLFADWYQPVTFGHDREVLELRWKGIEKFFAQPDLLPAMFDLVRLVFARPLTSQQNIDIFRQAFKSIDSTFRSTGNERELLILAGSTLALACIDEKYSTEVVALAILTSSACGVRKPLVEMDLVGMAEEKVRIDGAKARTRPDVSVPKKIVLSTKPFTDAIAPLAEPETQTYPQIIATLTGIGTAAVDLVNSVQKVLSSPLAILQNILTIQDEELQLLWWVVGGWSIKWDKYFNSIDTKARPILLGNEAASMTKELSELPSLKAVFSRIGVGSNKLSIPEAINGCGVERLGRLALNDSDCPTIFPLHFAIGRAYETGADEAWIAAWERISGIKAAQKIPSLDVAMQVHRELKLKAQIALIGK